MREAENKSSDHNTVTKSMTRAMSGHMKNEGDRNQIWKADK